MNEKLKIHSLDWTQENFEKLTTLFLNAVTEIVIKNDIILHTID